jgi:hypothetical protein
LVSRSLHAIEGGRLDEGRALLVRCAPYARSSSLQRIVLRMNQVRLAMAEGRFAGIARETAAIGREAEAMGNADMYGWAAVARLYCALMEADADVRLDWPAALPFPTGPQAPYLRAQQRIHALRCGLELPPQSRRARSEPLPEVMDVQIGTRAILAQELLLEGDRAGARREAEVAVALGREHGWELHRADAVTVLADLGLLDDDDVQLRVHAEDLAEIGARFPSARHAAEGRFFALSSLRALDPPSLEQLAQLLDVAPMVARRARALLGITTRLDAIDRRIVEAIGRRARGVHILTVRPGEQPSTEAWGLDAVRRSVWLPGGRSVTLQDQPVSFKLLAALAAHGGACSKERLAREAWGIAEYHPLRDDKRMQVAVRRLRLMVEEDPSAPARVLTTDSGYAIGVAEPMRWLRATEGS